MQVSVSSDVLDSLAKAEAARLANGKPSADQSAKEAEIAEQMVSAMLQVHLGKSASRQATAVTIVNLP